MQAQRKRELSQKEGRSILALQAYVSGQFQSVRRAAAAFNVGHQQLSRRRHKITFRQEAPPNSRKLSVTEEQTIVRYILNVDSSESAPQLYEVADIADKVLAVSGWLIGWLVGIHFTSS